MALARLRTNDTQLPSFFFFHFLKCLKGQSCHAIRRLSLKNACTLKQRFLQCNLCSPRSFNHVTDMQVSSVHRLSETPVESSLFFF